MGRTSDSEIRRTNIAISTSCDFGGFCVCVCGGGGSGSDHDGFGGLAGIGIVGYHG